MSTTSEGFFSTSQNHATLKRFAGDLRTIHPSEYREPNVVEPLQTFFNVLISNSAVFDELCAKNIEWIGQQFIGQLTNFPGSKTETKPESLLHIFSLAYRFLCELEFTQPGNLSSELSSVKNFVDLNLEKFPPMERQQLVWANYVMPAKIAKELIHNPAIAEFKDFANTVKTASDLKQTWDKEIEEKQVEIEALRNGINSVKTTYNFVALVKGFELLGKQKKTEKRFSFISLILLGVLMVTPVLVELCFIFFHIDTIESHRNTLVYSLFPLIALEAILLYLFRVVLMNFRSVTTQLLQIDLRISLCQFIQSYADYSVKIKKQDPGALDKFENLIFSGLISDSEALPSTFDGVEQFANLINAVRIGK
jgi:hypothetical protein